MKTIQIFTYTALSIFLIGCGGGSSSGGGGEAPTSEDKDKDAVMVALERYTVYPGNKVIKSTDNAVLKVTHFSGTDTSTVVLLEGNATIIRNP